MINPQIEEPKSSVDAFELPCGYLDEEGNLHTSVEINEMTGEEEEVLAAKNMPISKKVHKVLRSCVERLGAYKDHDIDKILPDLTQGDRIFILFAIRRVTLGNEMPFVAKCPECEQESMLTVDLADLEIKKMPDAKIRAYDVTLPKSKKKVRMKVLTGRGEDMIGKAVQSGKDLISYAILARVDAIDGKPAGLADLKAMSIADRNYLKNIWEDYEGGVETEIDVTCPQCDHEFKTTIGIGDQGFFNPLAASKTWKKKHSS
jgi:hypothetical protein